MDAELSLLIKDGNIGFYTKCEVIEIFGYDKEEKTAFNIFTLLTFEYSKKESINELLTDKLQEFSPKKTYKWGGSRRVISIDEAVKLFEEIDLNNRYNFGKERLLIGDLEKQKKKYIKPNLSIFDNVQINNVLKNNFHCGSYVLEYFDLKKDNIDFILSDPVCLNSLSEEVSSIIPIKISNVSDRLGNIIFQFPINKYKIYINSIPPNKGYRISFIPHEKQKRTSSLKVISKSLFDGLILDGSLKKIKGDSDINISISNLVDCEIFDECGLIIYKNEFSFLQQANFKSGIISPQYRNFSINKKNIEIRVKSNSEFSVGNVNKDYKEWVLNRRYQQELKVLEKNKSFIQYYGKDADRNKSLKDIRSLINSYGDSGVCLWDPFLSSKDIKNTLYYCEHSNSELRAITGLKQGKNKKDTIIDMVEDFNSDDDNYLLMNLEIRGRYGDHGYDFHDRFLIFPQEQPKVWSLGISVNQLGKSHHILQEVKNSQHILNAFNSLWNYLDNEECLVWKSI